MESSVMQGEIEINLSKYLIIAGKIQIHLSNHFSMTTKTKNTWHNLFYGGLNSKRPAIMTTYALRIVNLTHINKMNITLIACPFKWVFLL